MADAAVVACGFLDAPNVTAVELIPVPHQATRSHVVPLISHQATLDDLLAFHSDDYLGALKSAHATLASRGGSEDVSDLEDYGL